MTDPSTDLEQLPLAQVLLLEDACRRFEAAWRSASGPEQRPRIDPYLENLPESARPALRRELEALEQELNCLQAGPPESTSTTKVGHETDKPRPDSPTGSVVGLYVPGYTVLEELGHGGMAVVYKALNIKLKRTVALKLIHGGGCWKRGSVARFWAEAEVTAALRHPNVVQVFELGEYDGRPYMALEYVTGGTLADRLKAGPRLSPVAAASMVARIARGVSAAHDLNVVHRDLKPGNILLDADGEPKVSDFGLAKRAVSDLTQTRVLIGTPAYMSPEQAGHQAKFVTPATDVWALGIILYECLTGACPFVADQTDGLLSRIHLESPRPPRRLVAGLSRDLELICLHCLEKDPRHRYPTAANLAADLERFIEGLPVSVRPPGLFELAARWAKRKPALALASTTAVLALLAGSAASTVFGLRASDRAGLARAETARAEHEAWEAKSQTEKAREALLTNQRLLGLMNADEGVRLADEGRLALGLLRMAYPLAVAADCPEAIDLARLQFGGYTRNTETGYRLETIVAHADAVNSVEFSPDGLWIVTASSDKTARVWHAASGQPISPPLKHDGPVKSAVFSPEGQLILTASDDGTARIWMARTGAAASPPLRHEGPILSAVFSPDGRRVVTAGQDRFARVWDVATGEQIGQGIEHAYIVFAASFSPDGSQVITASGDKTARISDASTGLALLPPFQHTDAVFSALFNRDGSRVLSASRNGTARMWDAKTGMPVGPFLMHEGQVLSIAFSPDSRCAATASEDCTARLWDSQTGRSLTPPLRHDSRVMSVAFSPDGRRLLSTSFDGTARVWDAETGKPLSAGLQHAQWVSSGRFSPDSRLLATASFDRTARVWSVTPPLAVVMRIPDGPVDAAAFSPDGRRMVFGGRNGSARVCDIGGTASTPRLAQDCWIGRVALSPDGRRAVTGTNDGAVQLWDAHSGHALGASMRHSRSITQLKFSPDSQWVATASEDGTARVWNAATGTPRTPPLRHASHVFCIVFSPDGRLIATASKDRTARVWDARTGTAISPPIEHAATVQSVAFSPDGRRVVTASSDQTARVWDAATGAPATPPLQHSHWVHSAAFSPNGRFIVTASADKTARVWDAQTGSIFSSPMMHRDSVFTAVFSPDSKRLLTTTDVTARVWSAETGRPLTPVLRHSERIVCAAFIEDGQRVLTSSADGLVRTWDVTPDARPAADILRLAELMSSHRIDSTGGFVALAAEEACQRLQELRQEYPALLSAAPIETRRWRAAAQEGEEMKAKRRALPHFVLTTP